MDIDFILNIINQMGSGETHKLWLYSLLDILNNTCIIRYCRSLIMTKRIVMLSMIWVCPVCLDLTADNWL